MLRSEWGIHSDSFYSESKQTDIAGIIEVRSCGFIIYFFLTENFEILIGENARSAKFFQKNAWFYYSKFKKILV